MSIDQVKTETQLAESNVEELHQLTSDMHEDVKTEYTGDNAEQENSTPNGTTLKSAAVAAVAVAALTTSSPAKASIEDTINQLTEKFKAVFGDMLNSVMGAFLAALAMNQNENASKQTQAQAKSSDNIVGAIEAAEKSRIQRATEPPPDYCESDALGQDLKTATASAQGITDKISEQSIKSYRTNNPKGDYSLRVSSLTQKIANDDSYISLGNSLQSTSLTEEESKRAISSVEIMTASAMDDIKLDPSQANSPNRLMRKEYLNNSAKAIRLEIARSAFFTSIAHKTSSNGSKSRDELMAKEISRTYGSASWRNQINGYADPTPLLIELNKLQAFSNYSHVEQLKLLEKQNLLLATQTIASMSRS